MKAFPTMTTNNEGNEVRCGGMDLRDYFAAKVLEGLVGRSGRMFELSDIEHCYKIADAMMKAREQ